MEFRHMSITEFSEELDISRTALSDYVKAKGNPSVTTVEHIAKKLGIRPEALIASSFEKKQWEITLMLMDIIPAVSQLPEDRRIRFAELVLDMIRLWGT